MNINKNQVSAAIKKLLATILEKQDKKQWCEDDKTQLNKQLNEYVTLHRNLKYDNRAIKRMIWREFGIEFGDKLKPFVKPKEKIK
jgi:SOS response regulatory protein OraA/RecX